MYRQSSETTLDREPDSYILPDNPHSSKYIVWQRSVPHPQISRGSHSLHGRNGYNHDLPLPPHFRYKTNTSCPSIQWLNRKTRHLYHRFHPAKMVLPHIYTALNPCLYNVPTVSFRHSRQTENIEKTHDTCPQNMTVH